VPQEGAERVKRSTKEAWITGEGDLKQAEVEDVPVEGASVLVRGLPAAYSAQASSEALEMRSTPRGDQIATVNQQRLELLQFVHGVIEPKFNVDEAAIVQEKYGPAFTKIIKAIDKLSGVDKEALVKAEARFQNGVSGETGGEVGDGASSGSAGPDVPARTGESSGDDS
jgi:hypothetical protein